MEGGEQTETEKIEIMATGDSVIVPDHSSSSSMESSSDLKDDNIPPPPAAASSSTPTAVKTTPTGLSGGGEEIVRTLFVSGLPMDTTPRELYLLFRNFKGFLEARLSSARNKYGKILSPVGFVTFGQREEAEGALKELKDCLFDPYLPNNTLRLEFAKCNSKIPKDNSKKHYSPSPSSSPLPPPPPPPVSSTSTGMNPAFIRNAAASLRESMMAPVYRFPSQTSSSSSSGSAMIWPSAGLDLSPYYPHDGLAPYVDSAFGSSSSVLSTPSLYSLPSTPTMTSSHTGLAPTSPGQNPCSTLFVANLGSFVSEQEVAELFGSCPGYVNARLYTKGLSPVAFVKFLDVRCASQAMAALQGAFLRYSDRGGIRIEYAKSKMNDREGGGGGSPNVETVGFTGGDNNHNGWTPYPLVPLDSWIDHREPRDWPLFTGVDRM